MSKTDSNLSGSQTRILTGFFMNKIDFKNGHREILNRRADSWQDGWNKAETWMHGALWGIVALIAVMVFVL